MQTSQSRRAWLRDAFLVTTGAAAGCWLGSSSVLQMLAAADEPSGSPEARLRELNIELPAPAKPLAVYVPTVLVGETLYVSGTGPLKSPGNFITGRVGADLSLEEGRAAARLVGLNILSAVRESLGSLDRVVRLVKTLGMVNCTPEFTQQPQVINGFSELMVEIFGEEAGKGARSAVGMGSLPGNIPVEIEAIFQVRV